MNDLKACCGVYSQMLHANYSHEYQKSANEEGTGGFAIYSGISCWCTDDKTHPGSFIILLKATH